MNVRHECDIIKHNWILIERYSHQFSLINWTAHTRARWRRKFFNWQEGRDAEKKLSAFSLAITTTTRENRWERKLEDEIVSDCEENLCILLTYWKRLTRIQEKNFPWLLLSWSNYLFIQSFSSINKWRWQLR